MTCADKYPPPVVFRSTKEFFLVGNSSVLCLVPSLLPMESASEEEDVQSGSETDMPIVKTQFFYEQVIGGSFLLLQF